MLQQCPLVTGENNKNEEILEMSQKATGKALSFCPCAIPRVKEKETNAILCKWDSPHSHLQAGHEVGGHLTVCEAGSGKTSTRQCEHDLWHPEEHIGESKAEWTEQVEHP